MTQYWVKCCNMQKKEKKIIKTVVTSAKSSNLKLAVSSEKKKEAHTGDVTGHRNAVQDILKFIPFINKCKYPFPRTVYLFTFCTKSISQVAGRPRRDSALVLTYAHTSQTSSPSVETFDCPHARYCPPCNQPDKPTHVCQKATDLSPLKHSSHFESLFQGHWTWALEKERNREREGEREKWQSFGVHFRCVFQCLCSLVRV